MTQPPQLFQLAVMAPDRLMRFRNMQKDLRHNKVTLWMYGPEATHYCAISVEYVNTPFEDQAMGNSLSLEKCLCCLFNLPQGGRKASCQAGRANMAGQPWQVSPARHSSAWLPLVVGA